MSRIRPKKKKKRKIGAWHFCELLYWGKQIGVLLIYFALVISRLKFLAGWGIKIPELLLYSSTYLSFRL